MTSDGEQAQRVRRFERALAAFGHSSTIGLPATITAEEFGPLLTAATLQRLQGVLAAAVEEGAVVLPTAALESLAVVVRDQMTHAVRVERVALDVIGRLGESDIPSVVLKGLALAHRVYPDPMLRLFADVDLLVPPTKVQSAIDVAIGTGGRRALPEFRPGFDAEFGKDIPVVIREATVDLHRTLIRGPLGERVPTGALLERREPFTVGGRTLYGLEFADAYVHAGLTAGAADVPPRLVTLRDVLELERHARFCADTVLVRAKEWQVEAAVARAIVTTNERLRPDRPPTLLDWATGFVPSNEIGD